MEKSGKPNGMGTWRRYKLGQTQFTSWLTQTAAKLTTFAIGPRAGAASDKFVHLIQLEVFAQRVADNATPEDVPDSAINILRDVVSLRKKSFRFFSSVTKASMDEKLQQSNANHAQIINVLERVLARLESLVKLRKTREHSDEPKDGSRVTTSDLTNLFAYLEAHQKAGKRKGRKKSTKVKKPQRPADKAVAKASGGSPWIDKFRFGLPGEDEDEADELDLYMMVYCFFEDFNTIRNHVAERWCDYWYDRSVPLVTLAVVINAAFEFFHQLEHDLIRELRPHALYHYGIDHIDYNSYDHYDKKEADERIWKDKAEWLALPSYFELEHTLQIIPPGKTPILPPSQRTPTIYGTTTVEGWKTFQSNVTNQIVLESAHLKALKHNRQETLLPFECQLLSDLQVLLKGRSSTRPLFFSLQLWVDIRSILETDHVQPFHDMQATANKLKQALENHNPSKYCKDYDFKRSWLGRLWETKHFMVEDFMYEDKKARLRQVGIQKDPSPFFLLKHEPVWACLLDFRARLVYSELGQEFIGLKPTVDAAACLYHAALAEDPSLPRWAEMDSYVDTCVDDCQLKVGLRPSQGPAAIIRYYAASRGDENGPEKRAAGMDSDKRFIPEIAVRASLHRQFAFDDKPFSMVEYLEQLRVQLSQGKLTEPEVDKARALMGPAENDFVDGHGNVDLALSNRENGLSRTNKTELAKQRNSKLSQLSPIDILHMLDKTVTSQLEGILTLDYFKLWDESLALLTVVTAAFGDSMWDRLNRDDPDTPRAECIQRLPILLGQDLKSSGPAEQTDIIQRVVKGCRDFLQGPRHFLEGPETDDGEEDPLPPLIP
ncbi:hypothetical protein N658DRAFT_533172 [Parathielavia hyrcaniae]|uniref:DUF6604 domain-containing protein n=1 Tax=Parathielavia hyrcaniae TaxID=113614 RepID=A0AAN6Q3T7_9PEZI|nr:hypothetical protein N658DRAFT_533172 [Parathielavia hyrcaniae]